MELEDKYGAHNYHPLPVVLSRGEGVYVWDVEGKQYFDFLSAYSAVNQGHCHPRIVDTLIEQAKTLTLTSRAFYSDALGVYEKYVTEYFGYNKVLPMNTGAEGVETALKLCRKWAYVKKGIPEPEAKIIVCEGNFHGRTITIISMSTDPDSRGGFGPYTPGFIIIPYNDTDALAKALEDPKVAGFLVEPIQGEAGVMVPDEGYLRKSYELCKSKNVLFIADEVQTGIARTGKLLACNHENVRPDMVILGKALSGGVYPVSAVLADDEIMLTIKPGQHGSTFGGNPLATAAGLATLNIIEEEGIRENAEKIGNLIREGFAAEFKDTAGVVTVRNAGLMIGIELDRPCGDLVKMALADKVLINVTADKVVRLLPPLVMNEAEAKELVRRLSALIKAFLAK